MELSLHFGTVLIIYAIASCIVYCSILFSKAVSLLQLNRVYRKPIVCICASRHFLVRVVLLMQRDTLVFGRLGGTNTNSSA